MSLMRPVFLLLLFALLPARQPVTAQSSRPVGDAAPTQVLVLATPHLSQIEDGFAPALLDSLITVLEAYRPDVIGIEALSGPQIAEMKRRGGVYERVYEQFAGEQLRYGQTLQASLGLSWQEANAGADSVLSRIRDGQQVAEQQVADEARFQAVAVLLASYRLHTAAFCSGRTSLRAAGRRSR